MEGGQFTRKTVMSCKGKVKGIDNCHLALLYFLLCYKSYVEQSVFYSSV